MNNSDNTNESKCYLKYMKYKSHYINLLMSKKNTNGIQSGGGVKNNGYSKKTNKRYRKYDPVSKYMFYNNIVGGDPRVNDIANYIIE